MNGIKLYVPTKKGFLVLPSTSVKESRSIVRDVLASISTLAVEGDYQRMKKASSVMGTLGLLFIALSLAFQTPFLQSGVESSLAPAPLAGGDSAVESSLPAVASQEALDEKRSVEKSATAPSSEDSIASDEAQTQPIVSESKRASLAPALLLYTGILLLGSFVGLLAFSVIRKR